MQPPTGSIIAFATAEGETASDVSTNGRNGLYTKHMLKALKTAPQKHLRIDDMFMQINEAVTQASGGAQEPWYLASLKRPFCFGGCQTGPTVAPQPQPVPRPHSYVSQITPPPSVTMVPVPPPPAAMRPGKVFRDSLRDGGVGPEMVVIQAGRFQMGDIQSGGNDDEKPVHWVSVKKFAMGRYEVTFAEYDLFAEATGREKPSDNGWGRGNQPVINISWHDATAYYGKDFIRR